MGDGKKEPHRWKKDESGNPSGRPKNYQSLTYYIRQKINEGEGERAKDLANVIYAKALEGDSRMIALILDRVDGKVLEQVNLSGGLSLYEQGASAAAQLTDAASRAALLAEIKRLDGRSKK